MPLSECHLSLSLTDNPGSPFYAGSGEREEMRDVDSALDTHVITIVIGSEEIGETELKTGDKRLEKLKFPTYEMMVFDDKTEERTFYEVTRDTFLLSELKKKKVSGFSFFGINLFQKEVFRLPAVAFEPLTSSIEKFDVSKYRTKKENYLSYTLHREAEKAVLAAGNLPDDFIKTLQTDNFFYVIDHHEGQKFIGDISYREKFIKTVPIVEIQLIKRTKNIKEYELDEKGKVNKIIYL